jgi:hypothetical protein
MPRVAGGGTDGGGGGGGGGAGAAAGGLGDGDGEAAGAAALGDGDGETAGVGVGVGATGEGDSAFGDSGEARIGERPGLNNAKPTLGDWPAGRNRSKALTAPAPKRSEPINSTGRSLWRDILLTTPGSAVASGSDIPAKVRTKLPRMAWD